MQDFLMLVLEPFQEVFAAFKNSLRICSRWLTILIVASWLPASRGPGCGSAAGPEIRRHGAPYGLTVMMRKGDVWTKADGTVTRGVSWFSYIHAHESGLGAQVHASTIRGPVYSLSSRVFSAVVILVIGYVAAGFLSRTAPDRAREQRVSLREAAGRSGPAAAHRPESSPCPWNSSRSPEYRGGGVFHHLGGIVIALAIAFGVGGIDAPAGSSKKAHREGGREGTISSICRGSSMSISIRPASSPRCTGSASRRWSGSRGDAALREVPPIALVLPALYSSSRARPCRRSWTSCQGRYLNEVVLVRDKASEEEFPAGASVHGSRSRQHQEHPQRRQRITEIYDTFKRNGLHGGRAGQRPSAWLAYGYIISRGQSDVIGAS